MRAALPEGGATDRLVVVGSGQPGDITGFRAATGYDGPLYTDPSVRAFAAAGLARGWLKTFHPRTIVKGFAAFTSGFRQGPRRGNPVQQGGTFVLGPGARVGFEWRDRFAGDHPVARDVAAALAAADQAR